MFKIEKAFILSIVLIATISLIGWGFDLLIITRISNAFIPMAPLSSILFIFCGVAYWFSLKETKKPIHQITGKTLIFIALFILSLELLGGISNFDLEKIFVSNPSFFINVPIARISPFTVVFFYIVCFSYLLLSKIHVEIYRKTYAILTLILLLFSSIFLIGYVENLPLAYNSEMIPMALLTSLSFWILSLLKTLFWPDYVHFVGIRSVPMGLT